MTNRASIYAGHGGLATVGKIFGAPLLDVIMSQKKSNPDINIPLFLHNGFKYIIQHGLGIEGIFRIAGTKEKVKQLQIQIDKGEFIDFDKERVDPVDLADLMKIYFRELPDCLLQSDQYDHFISLLTLDRLGQIQKLRELVSGLKPENKEVLKQLVWFLGKIAVNASYNKMTEENLGLVWGPNLLWKGGKAVSTTDMMELMAGAGKIKLIVTLLIEEQDHVFSNLNPSVTKGDMKVSFLYKMVGGFNKTCQGISIVEDAESKSIWTANSAGIIKIFNSENYTTEKEWDSNLGRIHTMTSIKDHAWIATSQSVSLWNKSGTLVKEFPGLHASLTPVKSENGEYRIWAGTDQKITIFSCDTLEVVQTISIPNQFIVSIAEIHGESNQVWVGGVNGCIYIFDKNTGEEIRKLETPAKRNITCLTYHRYNDNGKVWAGSEDRLIFVIDPTDFSIVKTISHPDLLLINSLKSISNSVWSCSRDSTIRIWDSTTFQLIGSLEDYHTDAVIDAVLNYNNRNLRWEFWSASFDKTVCVWIVNSDSLLPPPPPLY
ncbi:hypothetical protein DICPUDRAFT_150164 [Dictyostelium purpureum]|uniref:Rho-GAP domain-containing protein n=1 Tax=Dictyostelium purpureum TaxID=5786 RepID=F0ZFL8_DICPU|nr:uncharacterized protein DICPUDRAFT_150164 [Dictyostelium purpureum]EGC37252.1 hypothetical protein DICPUDRAFT_150164 [Dictyostelium purpureum]|eukprot:XP_003286222.1 hypothetical protein DICPUDRAFT_150164 [Dictyostelium purpureum]